MRKKITLKYAFISFKLHLEYTKLPSTNNKPPKRKLPPINVINYENEWNDRILQSIKINVPESLSSQLNCTTFDLKKTEENQWLVTCPFCRSKIKIKISMDVSKDNRKSTNFRKSNFDYHLKRMHNWVLLLMKMISWIN